MYQSIMRTTREDVARHAQFFPAEELRRKVYCMAALGYPIKWIAEQIDSNTTHLISSCSGEKATADSFWKVDALFQKLKYLSAESNPAVKFTQAEMNRAKKVASSHNYFPPAAYNEDTGELVLSSLRDEERATAVARSYELAERRLTVVRMSLAGRSAPAIEEQTGIVERVVQRYRSDAGLKFEAVDGDFSVPRPECAERAAYLRDQITWYDSRFPDVDVIDFLHCIRVAGYPRERKASIFVDAPDGWRYIANVKRKGSAPSILGAAAKAAQMDSGAGYFLEGLPVEDGIGFARDGMVVTMAKKTKIDRRLKENLHLQNRRAA
jgi:hypothetical protein